MTSEIDNRLREYLRSESVVVHKTKDSFGGLSNMAGGFPLRINGFRIPTSEALYQACRFPDLPDVQREIIAQHSPMTAKMKGKPHRAATRSDWDTVRHNVMRWCLRVKLAQHYMEFGRLLLASKEKPIVEQSRKDEYWGAIPTQDGQTLVGENVLGRLLMELREALKADFDEKLRFVPVLRIPNFLLFGIAIETLGAEESEAIDDVSRRSDDHPFLL
ncbi:NADAR family protein [Xanthomonas campestris]|uniref:NADAR family protein n=1 Tax=Xanthomonas campestris TaxID=339 RepID=UPI0008A54324|nr:NADAR family protein [Xanthomonas campestris]MEB1153282.1 NADAR family protein [Xanthomonas campestris pv. campestris]MCC5099189.1 NADAR family protein [Xanthomonas campestris]MEA9585354.1 NADAR family protein [Xanthomonas campestris]MEA9593696.1 NADAR family protein [Xanthomonas campestris]MEA9625277.1 NADAR family protein [Xanthomonas campestris]